MSDHKVSVYDLTGTKRYEFTDFLDLSVNREVGAPGLMVINVSGEHALVANLQDKWQFDYWRKPAGQAWAREFVGIYRKMDWEKIDISKGVLTMPGIMSILGWRIVAWYTNTDNRSKFLSAKGETIMKTLVNYNAGASATTVNGRRRDGAITGLSVQADGANGNTVDWFCAYDILLSTLQDLAKVAGGDFDLVKTSSTTYEFRWYTGQLGTDRSATVTFSMGLGNMAEPRYMDDHISEATVAIVGGKGEGSARTIVLRTGATYDATYNNIETFVQATDANTGSGLQAKGDSALRGLLPVREFSFQTVQTPSSLYGVHYFLGDLVSGVNPKTDVKSTFKVSQAILTIAEDKTESVSTILTKV